MALTGTGFTELYVPFSAYDGILTRSQMLEAIRLSLQAELRYSEQQMSNQTNSIQRKIESAQRVVKVLEAIKAIDRSIVSAKDMERKVENPLTAAPVLGETALAVATV